MATTDYNASRYTRQIVARVDTTAVATAQDFLSAASSGLTGTILPQNTFAPLLSPAATNTPIGVTSSAWTVVCNFPNIPGFAAGSLVKLFYHVPSRNDSTGWGGMFLEPQISYDRGGSWTSLGACGLDGGVATYGSPAIGTYSNTIIIDPQNTTPYAGSVVTTEEWTLGSGGTPNFFAYGSVNPAVENNRILGLDPWGTQTILWQGTSDGVARATATQTNWGGGFQTNPDTNGRIDRTKLYRISCWMRRTNTPNTLAAGSFYYGILTSSAANMVLASTGSGVATAGTVSGNNYGTYLADLGGLAKDQWFLCVFHVYPCGTPQQASMHYNTGVYRPGSTTKVAFTGSADQVFNDIDVWLAQRISFIYSTTTGAGSVATTVQYVYPRMEVCDGTEPTIKELVDGFQKNTEVFKTPKADFDVQVRILGIPHEAVTVSMGINYNHAIDAISGTAPLASGTNGTQHYAHIIVEELALVRG